MHAIYILNKFITSKVSAGRCVAMLSAMLCAFVEFEGAVEE